jgi:hypothetical protein
MPVYEARCNECGKIHEYIRRAANYLDTPECCGARTQKVILSAPMGFVSHIEYTSPIDGRPITTKHARLDDLARNNSRPWEGMEQEQKAAQERVKAEEKAFDAKLEQTIAGVYNSLPSEKRQALEAPI